MDYQKWIDIGVEFGSSYGLKVIGAIVLWIVGSWGIKKISRAMGKAMSKYGYDLSLQKFLINLIKWSFKVLLIVVILGNLGVETTSFAALLAACGLAIGLALQGSLSNFAGGVLLMIFKPYKIGDLIEAQGEMGVVKEMKIFTTKLNTSDNKEIIIPNGVLSNGNITNYSSEKYRRVDIVMGVSYDADIKHTKDVLLKVITDNNKVLKDPEPTVKIRELADSSVNFNVKSWVLNEDYWTVYSETLERCKLALDEAGIEIPYPHQVQIRKKE